MEQKQIELSSIEATAYWWINVIKYRVREIVIQGSSSEKEVKFVKIFYYYTEREWRKLYLELIQYITQDVNNYISIETTYGIDAYNQDTEEKGHNDINRALSKIINQSIPDIRLASNNSKDSVIYTNILSASVWYKSIGVRDLPTKYEPDYILTGDEQKLDFYNLLISTISTLKEMDINFDSLDLLKERFCKAYAIANNIEDKEEIKERFNEAFNKACDKKIILRLSYEQTYFCSAREIDLLGLESYMDEAKCYADVILGKTQYSNITSTMKKLKRRPQEV